MKKAIVALIIFSTLSFSAAAADSYTVDPRHTFPSFEINHLGFSIQRGRFNQTSGKILLDPESSTGKINIAIETASISTGLAELEKHLRSSDFLDADRYPQITFVSDKLSFNKGQLVAADGLLTLHGISKPVHLTVDHFYCGMNLIAMNINRPISFRTHPYVYFCAYKVSGNRKKLFTSSIFCWIDSMAERMRVSISSMLLIGCLPTSALA